MDRSSPELVLLPTLLDAESGAEQVSAALQARMLRLHHLVVESEREARRMIRRILPKVDINQYKLYLLNEHSNASEFVHLLAPMEQGYDLGLMSDAGCPALADPGSALVMEVHRRGWKVVPFSGPSSIMLAWMSSGLNGQHMEFHGYLPVKTPALESKIRDLEAQSYRTHQTQIWIETPYRNQSLLHTLLRLLHPSTLMCIACRLNGGAEEWIKTCSVQEWKRMLGSNLIPDLHKKPCVFLLQCP
ncbi:MAG: SAM-dependent methyltransferase [Sphingomonadales bacterium]|nr:SAM-dependent methyltransferase [Sphingomonadales bacterium]MBM3931633.1 SAM-dependent methyltransferase [Sphingomonadales bacterium]